MADRDGPLGDDERQPTTVLPPLPGPGDVVPSSLGGGPVRPAFLLLAALLAVALAVGAVALDPAAFATLSSLAVVAYVVALLAAVATGRLTTD